MTDSTNALFLIIVEEDRSLTRLELEYFESVLFCLYLYQPRLVVMSALAHLRSYGYAGETW